MKYSCHVILVMYMYMYLHVPQMKVKQGPKKFAFKAFFVNDQNVPAMKIFLFAVIACNKHSLIVQCNPSNLDTLGTHPEYPD